MKSIILLIFVLANILHCQTYKVDLGGVSNQYPTQIEVVDGDLIIATTENFGKGYGIDAVSIINVTKNKVFRVANSSRQANPRILIDSNKILFTHWEITGGYDIGQILLLDKDFNILNKKQINFGGDTEIQSSLKYKNNFIFAGDYLGDGFISKYDIKLSELNHKRISTPGSKIYTISSLLIANNKLFSSYYNNDYLGMFLFNDDLTISNSIRFYNSNNYAKIARTMIYFSNKYYILTDNFTSGLNSFLNRSIHIVDSNLNYLREFSLKINNNSTNIKQIKDIEGKLYITGFYLENSKYKSFIALFDNNLNLLEAYNLSDYGSINDIIIFNNKYYLVGTTNNTSEYNADIIYDKTNNIPSICNNSNITKQIVVESVPGPYLNNPEIFNNNLMSNIGYIPPSISNVSSTTTEICTPISNNIDFQLLKTNFTSPCSTDSVSIEIVPGSSNINVVWFDGSQLKKRYFSKNGTYKVTLTIPGLKDSTFDVVVNSIYKGSATSNLSFTPDTLNFKNIDIDKLTCQIFTLTNVGSDTITLSELKYLKKLNFSSPNSIFPITLFPKESRDLEVCFYGNKFKTNYIDSIRFDNCNNPKFLTLLADIPEDTLSFTTRCMLKFDAAAPSKSIAMNKTQLNELIQELQTNYKLTNLLGLELFDVNAILPNQLVYLESNSAYFRILVIE